MARNKHVIQSFLKSFSDGTYRTYKSHLKIFFDTINADPNTYFDEDRDYEADVKEYWLSLKDKGRAGKTVHTAMAAVKSFLMEYDVELRTKFWKTLERRTKGGNRAVTIDDIPRNHELKEILQHGETKARALFLMASSSGMRISELLQLTVDDIDFNTIPTRINIRGETTKSGASRITFISQEATDALHAWLKERDAYLKYAIKKSNVGPKKTMDDPRIFPFVYNTAWSMWTRLLKKAGYDDKDKQTNIHKFHGHVLRKFFASRMSLELPKDVVEALLGHQEYLSSVYKRYTKEQLGELYLKGEQRVVIFQTPLDMTGVENRLQDLRKENLQIKQDLNRMMQYIERKTSIDLYSGGEITGGEWRVYEDGSQQLHIFDRETRTFKPFGEKIPPVESREDDYKQYLQRQEIMKEYYAQKHGLTKQQLQEKIDKLQEQSYKEYREEEKMDNELVD